MSSSFVRQTLQEYGVAGDVSNPTPSEKKEVILKQLAYLYTLLGEVRTEPFDAGPAESSPPPKRDSQQKPRLLIVSRTIPVIAEGEEDWKLEFTGFDELDHMSKCSLLLHNNTAIESLWLGWAGVSCPETTSSKEKLKQLLSGNRLVPVFLEAEQERLFYNGMCKSVLFPLFHSFPPTIEETVDKYIFSSQSSENVQQKRWQAYSNVNQVYADTVREVYREGDLILINGYHFMLLPQMLRAIFPNAKIGLFFHIQFPSSELYRLLPCREKILEGCLASDLIGFQTYGYARHFLSTAESLLMAECCHNGVWHNGSFTSVAIVPIGVDSTYINKAVTNSAVVDLVGRLHLQYKNKLVYLGIDDVEMIHGIPCKLLGVEEMFSKRPDLADRVAFIQVLLKHRTDNEQREQLEKQIMRIAARINSSLCRLNSEGPIQIRINPSTTEIFALYSLADVFVNTVLRDGMSANPMEYMIARDARRKVGVLVLSEFSGCARSLGGALLVSPWDTKQLADTLIQAQELAKESCVVAHQNMVHYIKKNTATMWGERFVEQLTEANQEVQRSTCHLLRCEDLRKALSVCPRRLFIFSLEGVLCRRVSLPELVSVPEEILVSLQALAASPFNTIVIQSPRSAETMELALQLHSNQLNCILSAENGYFVKWGPKSQWRCTLSPSGLMDSWQGEVRSVLGYYTERVPGAVLEAKKLSFAWHYSDCDLIHSSWLAKHLLAHLQDLSKRLPITVFSGQRCIDIRYRPIQSCFRNVIEICLVRASSFVNEGVIGSESLKGAQQLLGANQARAHAGEGPGSRKSSFILSGDETKASISIPEEFDIQVCPPDLVLLIASGHDPIDEDLFEYVEPNKQDFDMFLQSLERLEDPDAEGILHDSDLSSSFRSSCLERYLSRSSGCSPKFDLSPVVGKKIIKTMRQNDISSLQKFEPRKDFPPAGMLFKAIKRKSGEGSADVEVPGTAPACWAVINSTLPRSFEKKKSVPYSEAVYSLQNSVSKTGNPVVRPTILDPQIFSPPSEIQRYSPTPNAPHPELISVLSPLTTGALDFEEEEQSQKKNSLLPANTFSCKIGPSVSQAAFYIKSAASIDDILKVLNSTLCPTQQNTSNSAVTDDIIIDLTPPRLLFT